MTSDNNSLTQLGRTPTRGAADIVRMLNRREVSAVEIVDDHIHRVNEVNPSLNALVVERFEQARQEAINTDNRRTAGLPVGVLAGLPITIKECFDLVGTPTTAGADDFARLPGSTDADVVGAMRDAGAIVIGKTNLAQLCWGLETANPVYGRTVNPWSSTRTPGGSSGGEGALVAAHASPLGLGTDSGGSSRIPAHFCGIHGFKPTSGRLSSRGTADEDIFAFQRIVENQPGLMARKVEDFKLAYGVLVGALGRGGEPSGIRFKNPTTWPGLASVRIGYFLSDGVLEPSRSIRRVIMEALNLLAAAGAEILEFQTPGIPRAMDLFNAVFEIDGGATVRRLLGDSMLDSRMKLVLDQMPSRPLDSAHMENLIRECARYRSDFVATLQSQDIHFIVCPPAPTPAPPHGITPEIPTGSFTALFNLMGMPAGVVAASRVRNHEQSRLRITTESEIAADTVDSNSEGLPIGVQVVARPWHEQSLLEVMEILEHGFRQSSGYPLVPPLIGY